MPYVTNKGNLKGYGWSSGQRVLSTTLTPMKWVPSPVSKFQKPNHRRGFYRHILHGLFNITRLMTPSLQYNSQVEFWWRCDIEKIMSFGLQPIYLRQTQNVFLLMMSITSRMDDVQPWHIFISSLVIDKERYSLYHIFNDYVISTK